MKSLRVADDDFSAVVASSGRLGGFSSSSSMRPAQRCPGCAFFFTPDGFPSPACEGQPYAADVDAELEGIPAYQAEAVSPCYKTYLCDACFDAVGISMG